MTENSVYVLERLGSFYGPTSFLSIEFLTGWFGNLRVRQISSDGKAKTVRRVGRW